ncbi:hypothetical protein [Sphingobacterium daejeonense]|uniref:hypothetical protein n=1 Tax=Sphingobacterium daejeonense TaxID=371142 RepID=UPI0010C2AB39|nr:hypothetical protein [Sphingobacterium daejeonense]VTP96470.1 Uncharacterised protein [Sphingobacterium daejeonense]
MKNNNFKACFSEENFKEELFFSALIDDDNGFILEVNPINTFKILRIEFDYHVIYYEKIPDFASLKYIEENGLSNIKEQFVVFDNSDYIDKIVADSLGFYDENQIIHLLFKHTDGLIHILTGKMPKLIWQND